MEFCQSCRALFISLGDQVIKHEQNKISTMNLKFHASRIQASEDFLLVSGEDQHTLYQLSTGREKMELVLSGDVFFSEDTREFIVVTRKEQELVLEFINYQSMQTNAKVRLVEPDSRLVYDIKYLGGVYHLVKSATRRGEDGIERNYLSVVKISEEYEVVEEVKAAGFFDYGETKQLKLYARKGRLFLIGVWRVGVNSLGQPGRPVPELRAHQQQRVEQVPPRGHPRAAQRAQRGQLLLGLARAR